jgi:hypothetical protein
MQIELLSNLFEYMTTTVVVAAWRHRAKSSEKNYMKRPKERKKQISQKKDEK